MAEEEKKKVAPKKKRATTKKKPAPKKKTAPKKAETKVEAPALTENEAFAMAQQLANEHFEKKEAEEAEQKALAELDVPRNLARRHIRYRLFRIRRGDDEVQDDLKEYIQRQFVGEMSWSTFTFNWDVSPGDPLKVIKEDQWADEGGGHDVTGAYNPTAFTRQAQ